MSLNSYLVTPAQLNEALKTSSASSKVIPLCAAWFLPNDPEGRTGHASYLAKRIPNARFFDIDAIKADSPYPHMLASADDFAAAVGKLGISNDDTVVVYDTAELGIFSSPRVAFNFRILGHKKIHLLNNFRLWVEQELPTESGKVEHPKPVEYSVPAISTPKTVVDYETMKGLAQGDKTVQEKFPNVSIIDARPKGRFDGNAPEPRPGLPSGHIPGSTSVPFIDVLDPETKAFLPAEKLKKLLENKGVDLKAPIISSCGTGVSAAVLDTALMELGVPQDQRYLYDGSWTEWAMRAEKGDGLIQPST